MKVLVVEEHKILLESLSTLIRSSFDATNIIPASNADATLNVIQYYNELDLVFLNLQVSDINGIDLVEKIHQKYKTTPIVTTNNFYSSYLIEELLKLNVLGFLTPQSSSENLITALKTALVNKEYYAEEIELTKRLEELKKEKKVHQKNTFITKAGITERELEIIELMMTSKTNKEIATCLFLSNDTIKFHRKNIYKKTAVDNLLDLYKFLNRNNFFENE